MFFDHLVKWNILQSKVSLHAWETFFALPKEKHDIYWAPIIAILSCKVYTRLYLLSLTFIPIKIWIINIIEINRVILPIISLSIRLSITLKPVSSKLFCFCRHPSTSLSQTQYTPIFISRVHHYSHIRWNMKPWILHQ